MSEAYLAESEESNSDSKEQAVSKPSGSSSGNPIVKTYYGSTGPKPRYMLTLRKSILRVFHEWTCSQEDSRAKTSVMLERELALRGVVLASGRIVSKRLGFYDRESASLKTYQQSLIEDSMLSLRTLPRSGMMRSGIVYRLPRLVRLTDETESSSCAGQLMWPTPVFRDYKGGRSPEALKAAGRTPTNSLGDAVTASLWPTPTARESNCRLQHKGGNPTLSGAIMGDGAKKSITIAEAGGQLNPDWVEWLMGFPIGFTALKPSETQSFQRSRKQSEKQSKKK